jgi:hypothetical protein
MSNIGALVIGLLYCAESCQTAEIYIRYTAREQQ